VLRWLALLPLVAFALSCVAPVRVDPSAANRRRTVSAARTGTPPAHALSSAGKEPRIRLNSPAPRELGLPHAEHDFSLAKPPLFAVAMRSVVPRSLLVDHRMLIRRLGRTQHRPPAAPTNE
jgi:hypothetical protein